MTTVTIGGKKYRYIKSAAASRSYLQKVEANPDMSGDEAIALYMHLAHQCLVAGRYTYPWWRRWMVRIPTVDRLEQLLEFDEAKEFFTEKKEEEATAKK